MIVEYIDGKQEVYDDEEMQAIGVQSFLVEVKGQLILIPFTNVRKVHLPSAPVSGKMHDYSVFN